MKTKRLLSLALSIILLLSLLPHAFAMDDIAALYAQQLEEVQKQADAVQAQAADLMEGYNHAVSEAISIVDELQKAGHANPLECEHKHQKTETQEILAPTCTTPGSHLEVTSCEDCTLVLSQEIVEDPAAHDYIGEETVPATETEEGEMTYTCSRCGDTYTEPIPALNEEDGEEDGEKSEAFDGSETVSGVTVTVKAEEGVFPEGAKLTVTEGFSSVKLRAAKGAKSAKSAPSGGSVTVSSYSFDVTMTDADGRPIQPAEGTVATLSFALKEASDPNLTPRVLHETADGEETLNCWAEDGAVVTLTGGFSRYTVEFYYNSKEYTMPGDSEIDLSTVLSAVGLVGTVTDAWSSDPDLFSVSNASGEWKLTAKKAFSTTEHLYVTINDVPFDITVTDEQDGTFKYTVDDNGNATITGHVDGTNVTGSITIPSQIDNHPVTAIGNYAFSGCDSLTSVTIPSSVTSIGDAAFNACFSLTSVTIPSSVTSIGNYAFNACSGLTSITIPNSVTSFGERAFQNCRGLTSVTIGSGVTSIVGFTFSGCSSLTSVTIPNSVTSIRDYAFIGCSGLTSVTIGNAVTSIGQQAFAGCGSLTSVTIPDSVTSIGTGAFNSCTKLASVTIGNAVTSIGQQAFERCGSLTSVTIPDSVTSIGTGAFYSCTNLASLTIGNSGVSINSNAFINCINLTDIYFSGTKAEWNSKDYKTPSGVVVHCKDGDIQSYTVTCAAAQNGSVTAPTQAYNSLDVTLTVEPDSDSYVLDTLTVKSGETTVNTSPDENDATKYTFTMPAAPVTVTATFAEKTTLTITVKDQTYIYNGQEQGVGDTVYDKPEEIASLVDVIGLQGEDKLYSVVLFGHRAELGVYQREIAPSNAVIKNGDTTVTDNYYIEYVPGTLTITQPVTFTGVTETKTYTGSEIELTGFVMSDGGLLAGHTANVTYSAKGTDAGEYDGTFQSVAIVDGDNKDVTENYTITTVPGKLMIEPTSEPFTISLDDDKYTYDSQEHCNAKMPTSTAESGTTAYSYSFEENGTYVEDLSTLTQVNAGEYTIYVKATNPNYKNPATTTAKLSIEPAKASVTVDNKTKQIGDKDPELTATVTGLVGSDKLNYTLSRTEGEEAGEYDITVTLGDNPNYDVTPTNGKLTITALPTAAVTVTVDPEAGGTVNGAGTYEQGAKATLTAKANEGYKFVNWTENGQEVSTEATLEIEITADRTLTANFELLPTYTVIWLDGDDKELDSKTYKEGEPEPTTDRVPTKAEDDKYTYEFSKWKDGRKEGNVTTYSPIFTAKEKPVVKPDYYFENGNTPVSWPVGTSRSVKFVVHRIPDDGQAFSHFLGVQVGSQVLSPREYTAQSGSVEITLLPSYVRSLPVGSYRMIADFDDGSAETLFVVYDPGSGGSYYSTSTSERYTYVPPSNNPRTGDDSHLALWGTLACLSAAGAMFTAKKHRRKEN